MYVVGTDDNLILQSSRIPDSSSGSLKTAAQMIVRFLIFMLSSQRTSDCSIFSFLIVLGMHLCHKCLAFLQVLLGELL